MFIRDICVKFGIPHSRKSPDIGQNSDGDVSDLRISGKSLVKEIVIAPEPTMTLTWNLDQ